MSDDGPPEVPPALVDRALLEALDRTLAEVPDAIEWALRASNRVVWHDGDAPTGMWIPPWADGVRELYGLCSEIKMADVGNGWFVHRALPAPPDDPYVPLEVARSGRCFPLGSDGGGGWLVVADGGVVWHLVPGLLRDHVYDPAPGQVIEPLAPSVRALFERLHDEALSTIARDDDT